MIIGGNTRGKFYVWVKSHIFLGINILVGLDATLILYTTDTYHTLNVEQNSIPKSCFKDIYLK